MNDSATTSTPPIFAPLWQRKWMILLVALVVAAGTYLYYKRKPSVYQASTQIYLGAGAEEAGLLGGSGSKALTLNGVSQTTLIDSAVAEAVRKQLRGAHDFAAARGTVQAKAAEKSQFITVTAEARTPRAAALLANLTARTYIQRERSSYLIEVEKALGVARAQLHRVQQSQGGSSGAGKHGRSSSSSSASSGPSASLLLQIASLTSKVNQLETELSIKGVQQLTPAKPTTAALLSPKPRQNAIFGFMIGLLLGAVAAYGLSRLNPRLRSLTEVEESFQTKILAALPTVRSAIVEHDGRSGPAGPLLEPLRRLHTTLQLGTSIDQDQPLRARSIVFVSADPDDGKSTLIANFARVQCEASARVVVLDADLRRPAQARLLSVSAERGLEDVLAGRLAAHDAIQRVDQAVLGETSNVGEVSSPDAMVLTKVRSRGANALAVLASREGAPNPPALLASPAMTELLDSLAGEFDYVLIDAPSPLEVSDVMPLLNAVDGIVIVARIEHTRRASATRLEDLLARTSSAPVLGAVANCVPRGDIQKYGFSLGPGGRGARKLIGR